MTKEQMEKLPKWAQQEVKGLIRECTAMAKALHAVANGLAPTDVYYELDADIGRGKGKGPAYKFYVPAKTVNFKLPSGDVISVSFRQYAPEPKIQVSFPYNSVAMLPEVGAVCLVSRPAPLPESMKGLRHAHE